MNRNMQNAHEDIKMAVQGTSNYMHDKLQLYLFAFKILEVKLHFNAICKKYHFHLYTFSKSTSCHLMVLQVAKLQPTFASALPHTVRH